MFKEALGVKKIVVACGHSVDLRRGIDGLAAVIRLHYALDPLEEGTLFLFCGTKRNMIKGLIFEGDGYCLCSYRLINGKFQWPRSPDEARDITPEQYRLLMSGFTIEGTIPNSYNSWLCGKRTDQAY